jgi:hypothetical protein
LAFPGGAEHQHQGEARIQQDRAGKAAQGVDRPDGEDPECRRDQREPGRAGRVAQLPGAEPEQRDRQQAEGGAKEDHDRLGDPALQADQAAGHGEDRRMRCPIGQEGVPLRPQGAQHQQGGDGFDQRRGEIEARRMEQVRQAAGSPRPMTAA